MIIDKNRKPRQSVAVQDTGNRTITHVMLNQIPDSGFFLTLLTFIELIMVNFIVLIDVIQINVKQ